MAVFIAAASGVLSSAGAVWKTVDATSLLYAENATTNLTTAYVESQAFTPGAITVTGHAVLVTARVASPTGTISTRLAQAGATVAGTEVTINVSDLERPGGLGLHYPGLYFFKYAAPVTLLAATPYTLSAKCSVNAEAALARNATAGNWTRLLRTDTFGNPGAGDDWHVLGEYTAAATKTDIAVEMDEVAVTDYGSGGTSINLPGVSVGKGGSLTYGNAAGTNYMLQLSTTMRIWKGGTFSIGIVGAETPRTSTKTLQFDCAADGDFGLLYDGTMNGQGLSRTSGKNVVQTTLNTDEAAAQTVLGVTDDTGWLNGDIIDIASTTRTFSQSEQRTLASDATATTVTVTAGLTNAHSGTSPTQAEVILLTRNVIIRSVSTSAMSYVVAGDDGVGDFDWVWFRYLGVTTDYKRGFQARTQAGSLSINYCTFSDFEQYGLYLGGTTITSLANISVQNSVFSTRQAAAIDGAMVVEESDGSNLTLANLTVTAVDGASGNRQGFAINAWPNSTISGLRASGCESWGLSFGTPTSAATLLSHGVISDLHSHSNSGAGLYLAGNFAITVTGVQLWRNNVALSDGGLVINGPGIKTVIGGQIFGNSLNNIMQNTSTDFRMLNVTVAADTTFSVADGLEINGSSAFFFTYLSNCTFGDVSGIFTAHTNDINFGGGRKTVDITLNNCLLDSGTEFTGQSVLQGQSVIREQRVDTATAVHQREFVAMGGTASYETVTFRTAAPSEKLAPDNANLVVRLESSPMRVRVDQGETISVAVYGLKDASYSGVAARLMLRANPALGVDTDTLLDTHSVGINIWEQLTGTTPVAEEDGVFEFYVDVTGTGGAFYVDDWSASQS